MSSKNLVPPCFFLLLYICSFVQFMYSSRMFYVPREQETYNIYVNFFLLSPLFL